MNLRNLNVLLLLLITQFTFAQQWGVNTESEFTNEATDVTLDASGNSYVTGYITGQTAFTSNNVLNNALGNGDVYVAKYSSGGSLIWTKHFSGAMSDKPFGIEIDNNGDLIVAGYFTGELTLDGITLNSVNNSRDIFFAKLDENGTVLWAKKDGGSGAENLYGLTIDNQNNIILTGQFKGDTEIGGQTFQSVYDPVNSTFSYDLFLVKYTPQGNPIWVERSEAIYEERGLSVDVDSQDNIFISGQFSDTMTFAGQQINNNGYNVGFVSKLNTDGQIQWFNTLKAGMAVPYSLTINNAEEVIVTGDFRGTLYHTSSFGTSSLTNPHLEKIFAIKISNSGEELWANAMGSDSELSARSVDVDDSKNIYIVGHFKCALTELQTPSTALYNSVGGRDIFLWNMSNSGNNMITRQMGGKLNDYAYAVKMKGTNEPLICGSYTMDLHVPESFSNNLITDNQSNFNFHSGWGAFMTAFLHGDESVNSFLTNGFDATTPEYNYFINSPTDSLNGSILPNTDTMHICDNTQISYEAYTYQHTGPGYYYNWSTGDTTKNTMVENSGTYTVEVERWDQCSADIDSLEVVHHPSPPFPLISDSLGIQSLDSIPYADYTMCYPDSVYIWFNDLDTSLTFSVNGPGLSISDTLPHLYSNEGTYSVEVSNQQCSVTESFELEFDHILNFDIDPYMVMEDGDSLTLCEGDAAVVQILDAITNPDTIYGQYPTTPVISYSWEVNGPAPVTGGSNEFWRSISPTVSGWYDVEYTVTVGYDNACGIDSVSYDLSESYYFEVLEQPDESVTISGDLLCPDGSVYLHIPYTIDGLSWSGPGIEWMSSDGDSIQATAAGTYYYQGTQTDTVTGCTQSSSFSYTLTEKIPPLIFTNPGDGIVCPYDSVDMWVDDNYVSYEWSGPSGMGLSFTDQHTDEELGFYYCTVLDADGCYLTSPPVELKEFSSPYLSVEPTNVICDSEPVTLMANFITSSGAVDWSSPLSGNSLTQQVNQPGWYVAEITSCNITTLDSIEIIDGSFSLSIQASDSSLCYGDTIEIQGPSGLSNYEWSSGESGVSSIYVTSAGDFSLTAINNFGCEAQSNEIPITFYEASGPPTSDSIVLCTPEILVLENNSGFSTNWYSSDTLLQDTGVNTQVSIVNDTSIFLAHDQNDCPLNYGTIEISIIPEISDSLSIQGPDSICANDLATYFVGDLDDENIQWLISGDEISNDTIVNIQGVDLQGEILQAIISNTCHSDTLELSVTVFTADSIDLPSDTIDICSNDPVELYVNGETESVFWSGVVGNNSSDTLIFNSGQEGFVFVQVVDSNGCLTNSDSTFINILNVDLSLESNILGTCYDDTVVLWVDAPVDTLIWTTPSQTYHDTLISIALNDFNDGWYYLDATDSMGCTYNDSIEIDSNPNSNIPVFWDSIVCEGTIIPAEVYVDSIYSGPNSVDIISEQQVTTSGWYTFTVENFFGCVYEDSVYIETYDCSMQFPNVITANNDGSNDLYIIPSALAEPNNLFIVLNRWGQTVFEESGYKNTFSGTDLTPATYFYMYYPDYESDPDTYYSGFFHLIKD